VGAVHQVHHAWREAGLLDQLEHPPLDHRVLL
jgi:hypothetical protein